MKKKHRDIIVDGVRYGWIMYNVCEYSIYLNNQVIITRKTDERFPITPKIIESEIRKWINKNS